MKVLCVRSNKKLLKGLTYDCDYINTGLITHGTWSRRQNTINIVGFGSYSTTGFRFEDGTKIPIDYSYGKINRGYSSYSSKDYDDINIGDWVICNSESFKTMIKGQKYQVEDVRKAEGEIRWNNRHKIKLKGSSRFVDFGYKFKKVPKEVSRDLVLKGLFDEDVVSGKVGEVEDLDRFLMEILAKSILDKNRHHLDVIDWAINKYGKAGIQRDNFKNLLNKKLKAILETL